MWPINLSVRLPIVDLVSRYLTNYLIGREPIFQWIAPLIPCRCLLGTLCGISSRFQLLSPSERQVAHALLTRPPLIKGPKSLSPFDLNVLGTPPAFILSQDQTLDSVVYSHSFERQISYQATELSLALLLAYVDLSKIIDSLCFWNCRDLFTLFLP